MRGESSHSVAVVAFTWRMRAGKSSVAIHQQRIATPAHVLILRLHGAQQVGRGHGRRD